MTGGGRWFARWRRFARDASAAVSVELALILPALIFITLAGFDAGRLLLAANTLDRAAHDAARWAGGRSAESDAPATESDISAYALGQATGLDTTGVTVSVTWTPSNAVGAEVTVALAYSYDAIVGDILQLDPLNLSANSTVTLMR